MKMAKKRHIMTKTERIRAIKRSKWLYVLMILPVLYYAIFCYAPMYGILIAFENYKISKGVFGSEWVG
ncbi:MAG: sugar ABC transporter permease, partial [Lachnospiraceae bacterium]|nr:sugar ABC transporter permease [Lachnospiraceae bacterium]